LPHHGAAAQTASPPPTHVTFSTFLGGSGRDPLTSIAVDGSGRTYVAGMSCSPDMPTTTDALRRSPVGCDGYLAMLSPSGSLLYGTYLGGAQHDGIDAIAVDTAGSIYVAGHTASADFPTTAGAYDRSCGID